MSDPSLCMNGDVVTIGGIYNDGTHAPNEGPYDAKPLQRFRLEGGPASGDISAYRLVPIDENGQEIAAWTWAGEYRIGRRD